MLYDPSPCFPSQKSCLLIYLIPRKEDLSQSFYCEAKIKWGHELVLCIRLNIQKMSGEHFNDGCIYIIVRTVSVFVRAGS